MLVSNDPRSFLIKIKLLQAFIEVSDNCQGWVVYQRDDYNQVCLSTIKLLLNVIFNMELALEQLAWYGKLTTFYVANQCSLTWRIDE